MRTWPHPPPPSSRFWGVRRGAERRAHRGKGFGVAVPITVAPGPARRVGFPPGHAASFGAVPAAWCWVHRSVPRSSSRAASFPRHPPPKPPRVLLFLILLPRACAVAAESKLLGMLPRGGSPLGPPPCAPSHPSHCWGGAAGAGGASRGALRPTTAPPSPAIHTLVLLHLLELGFRADFWLNPEAGCFGKGAGHQQCETQRDNTGEGSAEPTAGCCSSPLYTKLPFFPPFAAISAFFFFCPLPRRNHHFHRPHSTRPETTPPAGAGPRPLFGDFVGGRVRPHGAARRRAGPIPTGAPCRARPQKEFPISGFFAPVLQLLLKSIPRAWSAVPSGSPRG